MWNWWNVAAVLAGVALVALARWCYHQMQLIDELLADIQEESPTQSTETRGDHHKDETGEAGSS